MVYRSFFIRTTQSRLLSHTKFVRSCPHISGKHVQKYGAETYKFGALRFSYKKLAFTSGADRSFKAIFFTRDIFFYRFIYLEVKAVFCFWIYLQSALATKSISWPLVCHFYLDHWEKAALNSDWKTRSTEALFTKVVSAFLWIW